MFYCFILFMCTLPFKYLGSARFFERSLFCSPRLHLFDQKYNKNGNVVKYYNLK